MSYYEFEYIGDSNGDKCNSNKKNRVEKYPSVEAVALRKTLQTLILNISRTVNRIAKIFSFS